VHVLREPCASEPQRLRQPLGEAVFLSDFIHETMSNCFQPLHLRPQRLDLSDQWLHVGAGVGLHLVREVVVLSVDQRLRQRQQISLGGHAVTLAMMTSSSSTPQAYSARSRSFSLSASITRSPYSLYAT